MSAKPNYFKIGIFVVGAIALIVIGLTLLGAETLFRERLLIETYFDESVTGLETGAPVFFRGVHVGNVNAIDFVQNIYPVGRNLQERSRLVYVLMEIKRSTFSDPDEAGFMPNEEKLRQRLQSEIDKGMRVQLSLQGVTGIYYLDIDYIDPERHPPREVEWIPHHYYIPSVPSAITQIADAFNQLFGQLAEIDIERLIQNLDQSLASLSRTLDQANISEVSTEMRGTLESLRHTSDEMRALVTDPHIGQIKENVAVASAEARQLLETTRPELSAAITDFRENVQAFNQVAGQLNDYLESERAEADRAKIRQTLDAMHQAAAQLPRQLQRTLQVLETTVETERADIQAILENLRVISNNLRDLTEAAREYPSGVLFGEPPPPVEPYKE